MIRARENTVAWRAGAMSVLVHGLLLALFLFSVNWKSTPPMSVAEVELWDNLPVTPPVKQPSPPTPEPTPEPPKPQPPKPEPKAEPDPEPKAEIQLKQEKPKPKVEKPPEKPIEKPKELPKPDPAIKAKELEKQKQEALKKLQQQLLAEDSKVEQHSNQKQEAVAGSKNSQASAGEIEKYISQISSKIRGNVNKELCGTGNPELQFAISLIPTGDVIGEPKLLKGSGMAACDAAVERAIVLSQPLPVPKDPALFSQFRDLKLKFRPNDGN
ncbi:MAG TPA: TonB C-terminal domain-containing protein [Methylophilaceae bacterium]|nr:TonB C-terminal domain-containing protein [Methylophilaceae bacterium]